MSGTIEANTVLLVCNFWVHSILRIACGLYLYVRWMVADVSNNNYYYFRLVMLFSKAEQTFLNDWKKT